MKHLFFIYLSRAKEKHIADETDFSRMINSSGLDEAFKVLQDTDYAPYALSKKADEYESLLDEEKKAFKDSFLKLGAKGELLEILSLRQDNISKIIKKIKSKEVKVFLKSYGEKISSLINSLKEGEIEEAKRKEEELIEEEKEFILNSEMKNEGLSPFFAYLLKKKRAERSLRIILSSKKIGLSSSETTNLLKSVRAI